MNPTVILIELSDGFALSIDCPELSTLTYFESDHTNLMDVKQPQTIKKLNTGMSGPKLAPFKSVECLVTYQTQYNFEAVSQATLLSLPALRELRYNPNIEGLFEFAALNPQSITIDQVKRTLSEFLGEAKRLSQVGFPNGPPLLNSLI